MGDIGYQLRLHPLALYLLLHCFFKACPDLLYLIPKRLEHAQILCDLHIQISLRQLIRRSEQDFIFFLHPVIQPSENQVQDCRVYDQPENPKEPETAEYSEKDKIDSHDPDKRLCGALPQIYFLHLSVAVHGKPF